MMLITITGRANSGKTWRVYELLDEALARGARPTLLLPSQASVARAQESTAKRFPVGLSIREFDSFLAKVWSREGDGRVLVRAAQRLEFVKLGIEKTRLGALVASADTPGFAPAIARAVKDLIEERDTGRVLAENAETHSSATGPFGEALQEIAREYEALLDARGLVEAPSALAELVARCVLPDGVVFAHQFSVLTPTQEALLCALARVSEQVAVTLPWEEGHPATEALTAVVRRLQARGEHEALAPSTPDGGSAEVARLSGELFQPESRRAGAGDISFIEAHGPEAEAFAAARAARQFANQGFRPDEIAVVFRRTAERGSLLRRAFAEEGIAIDFDAEVSLTSTGLGRSFVAALKFIESSDRCDLVAYLRTAHAGADQERVDALDARWRSGKREASVARMLADLERECPESARQLRHLRRVASRPLDEKGLRAVDGLLREMLRAAWGAHAPTLEEEGQLDAAAQRAILGLCTDLISLCSARRTGAYLLDAVSQGRTRPRLTGTPGRVQIISAERARVRRFSCLIIGGLTSVEFSGAGQDASGVDALRLRSATTDGNSRAGRVLHERLLFYLISTRASQRLTLLRQGCDENGTYLRPSIFWEEVKDLYPREGASGAPPVRQVALGDVLLASSSRHRKPPPISALQELEAADLELRETFAAGELEAYVRCPYRWFLDYALSPKSLDRTLDALEKGRLAHRVMQRFYESLPAALGERRLSPNRVAEAQVLLGECFDTEAGNAVAPKDLRDEYSLQLLASRLARLVAQDAEILSGFVPLAHEWSFGLNTAKTPDEDPPEDLGGFFLRGRVDRIDEGPNGLVVMDYKTGAATAHPKFEEEGVLQVPLYSLVARQRLGRPVVGGLYRSISEGKNRGFVVRGACEDAGPSSSGSRVTQDEADEIIGRARDTAARAVAGIREGRIPAEPKSETICVHCAALAVCQGARA